MISLSQKQCVTLWAILTQKEPEIASKLVRLHIPQHTATETDLKKIPELFTKFCIAQNLEPENYKGALFKSHKIDQRRLFIGTLVQLYGNVWGLATAISLAVNQHRPATTKMIGEVMMCYDTNDSFSEAVDAIVVKMKGGEDACA